MLSFNNDLVDSNIAHNEQNIGEKIGEMAEHYNLENINRLETPITLNPETATFDDIAVHAFIRQRLAPGTVSRNLRYARFMENYTPQQYAVDFKNPSLENLIRHLDFREQVEGSKRGALRHEYQAYHMFWKAWGRNPHELVYRPPKQPKYNTIPIAYPDQIHTILHQRYNKDYHKDSLIKHILTKNFFIGWRFPSEPCVIKTSDVDIENQTILITSPKLHDATRLLDIAELEGRHNIYNFKNYIDKVRPRFENQHSKDYLFISYNGHPFTEPDNLRMFMYRNANAKIKSVIPKYYNYTCRHWCAIARLIRTKIQSKHFDEYEVKEWLGHTKIETTMNYIQHANFYYKKQPVDWIKRVLRNQKHVVGDNTLKTRNRVKSRVWFDFTPVGRSRRLPTAVQGIWRKIKPENRVFGRSDLFTKPLLFSFYTFIFDIPKRISCFNLKKFRWLYSYILPTLTKFHQQETLFLHNRTLQKKVCFSIFYSEKNLFYHQDYYNPLVPLLFDTYNEICNSIILLKLPMIKENNNYYFQKITLRLIKKKNLLIVQKVKQLSNNEDNNILFLNYLSYNYQYIKYEILLKILWVSLALKKPNVFFDTPTSDTHLVVNRVWDANPRGIQKISLRGKYTVEPTRPPPPSSSSFSPVGKNNISLSHVSFSYVFSPDESYVCWDKSYLSPQSLDKTIVVDEEQNNSVTVSTTSLSFEPLFFEVSDNSNVTYDDPSLGPWIGPSLELEVGC